MADDTPDKKTTLDLSALKTGGVIKQRQKDLFTIRLKCPGGRVTLDKLERIHAVARKYGRGYVHISVRQSIEVPYVNLKDFDQVRAELAEVGQEIASCGARVRVPTACAGCEYNPKGLTDTQAMAQQVCEEFFGKQMLPHKFKVAFAGCPNDCVHSSQMDLGFQGAVRPVCVHKQCIKCGLCAQACVEGAITLDPDTDYPEYDREKCLYCGDCIRACSSGAWQAETTGWMVRVGGKHGRHPIESRKIAEFVPDEKVREIVATTLAWYTAHGRTQGRVRLGHLLLDETAWRDYLAFMRLVLGRWAVAGPPPPEAREIHR